ncbi:MAG: metallophosphoesterase [Nitrospirota bacterium]
MRWFVWGFKGIALVLIGLIIYGIWIEPNRIEIHHIWICDKYLGKVLEKKIVVRLSYLHISRIRSREQEILKILNELKPDFIFLTGDYVKWNGDHETALNFLSQLKARIGIWGVLGDYDYSNSRKSCLFCHEAGSWRYTSRYQIHFLRNSLEKVNLSNVSFWIGGGDIEEEHPEKSFSIFKKKEPVIILSHSPLSFDFLDKDQDVLMLAGDTHGGQIPLPSWLWRIMGYKKTALYCEGIFKNGDKKMFVSRGIGTSHFPIRLFRQPEIVVLHFNAT